MDLYFDTFFMTISSAGMQIMNMLSKVKWLPMFFSTMTQNGAGTLKCLDMICCCSSFVYFTKMCRKNERIYISKSFCVSKFGKVAVTSTLPETAFSGPMQF
jgi:hypothetical protein